VIGIESELPVVDRHGEAAGREAMTALFQALAADHDFEPYHDGHTGALVGVHRLQGAGRLDVGTDFGFCTLEVALPPERDLQATESAWEGFMDGVLLPTLAALELSVLGYGSQPKTAASGRPFVADKGHYELWTSRMELCAHREAIDPWPSYAALQFNLDVPQSQVIPAVNTLISLSPLICAWSANSPVFGGLIQPWLEMRAKGYLMLAEGHPFFAGRLWFAGYPYASLAGYLWAAWELPIFEVVRRGKVFHPLDPRLTTLDYAAAGAAEFVDLGGAPTRLTCTAADLALGVVFAWPAVRVKVQLDLDRDVSHILEAVAAGRPEDVLRDRGRGTFVEVRHLPTMGRTESFAWLAMFFGWLADVDALAGLVEGWSTDEVKTCFDRVLVDGWETSIARRTLPEWGSDALAIARRALPAEHAGRLEPLRRRLQEGTSPASDAVATFRAEGVDALVARLRWA
jgi:gamma-glutamylcysteine synthetase